MKGFRVYDKDACQYVTDELYWVIDCDGNLKSFENGGLISYPSCISESDTGLKDKHGKKIFEGDIVVYCINSRRHRGIIRYDIETCSFRCYEKRFKNEYETKAHINANDYLGFDYVEAVIGNIHDNPELLEETEQ